MLLTIIMLTIEIAVAQTLFARKSGLRLVVHDG